MTYRTWTLGRFALAVSLALATAAACGGGGETPDDSIGGAGGATSDSGSGGTPGATGGTPSATGGNAPGEGGRGGEGGGEPNEPDPPGGDGPVICGGDEDCEEFGQVCAGFRRVCVDCAQTADCDEGEVCVRNACEPRAVCEDSLDCPSLDLVCVSEGGGPGPDQGLCLECATDADCEEEESCADNVCVRGCASDKDCTPLGLLCDFESGSCVECLDASRCAEGEYCADGACMEAVCTPGETVCVGDDIASCNETGSGYGELDQCFNGTCDMVDGEATCVD